MPKAKKVLNDSMNSLGFAKKPLNQLLKNEYEALMKCPNGLSYFNGTACPLIYPSKFDFEGTAMKMLKGILKDEPIKEVKTNLYNQSVEMEKVLSQICNGKPCDNEIIAEWSKHFDEPAESLMLYWYCNVYMLLKLKVIENDNNYGMLFATTVN